MLLHRWLLLNMYMVTMATIVIWWCWLPIASLAGYAGNFCLVLLLVSGNRCYFFIKVKWRPCLCTIKEKCNFTHDASHSSFPGTFKYDIFSIFTLSNSLKYFHTLHISLKKPAMLWILILVDTVTQMPHLCMCMTYIVLGFMLFLHFHSDECQNKRRDRRKFCFLSCEFSNFNKDKTYRLYIKGTLFVCGFSTTLVTVLRSIIVFPCMGSQNFSRGVGESGKSLKSHKISF